MKTLRAHIGGLVWMGTILLLAGTSLSANASNIVLSYWNFNNVSTAYGTTNEGVFTTTTNGPGTGTNANGELYDATTSRLSSNSSVSAAFSDPSNVYIDFSGTLSTGGANGLLNGNPVNPSSNINPSWGAFKDASTNTTLGQSTNLVSGDTSTQSGALVLFPGNKTSTSVIFDLSSLGYSGISISFADRATASTAISSSFSYFNGTTWVAIGGTLTPGNGSFSLITLALPSALDNLSSFQLKMTATFPTNSETSLAIDNFQVNATAAVPEPSALACLLLAAALAWRLRLAGRGTAARA